MSDGLTRDGLFEIVRGAACSECHPGDGPTCEFQSGAADAVDVVLRAVADDLEAHRDAWIENVDYLSANGGTQVGIDQAAGSAMALGVAAERVRALLGKDKTNE